jgi:hypothetical protein
MSGLKAGGGFRDGEGKLSHIGVIVLFVQFDTVS